jgi:tetratricopeptide (TPR) repeat protein/predicted Ser/Thr protein kinase
MRVAGCRYKLQMQGRDRAMVTSLARWPIELATLKFGSGSVDRSWWTNAAASQEDEKCSSRVAARQLARFGSVTRLPLAIDSEANDKRYEFERTLGQGGTGAVYLVRDRESGERLAFKKLFRMDQKSVLRLKREFRSMADIHHPNLVKLYDLERGSDAWFLTMEYLDGHDLLTYVDQASDALNGAADRPRLHQAFHQLASGVRALHKAGMLHRDLKPSNVMVADHRVVVLDFGLVCELDPDAARVTVDGSISGTPAYMAPEQVLGGALSEATDWYAFGVMLYEALSGELPIDGKAIELLRKKLDVDPIALDELVDDVPPALSDLCMSLLRRNPRERPSGAQVLAVLEQLTAGSTRQAPQLSTESILRTETQSRSAVTRLFGRAHELKQLWEAMAQAEDGQGVVVHVRGASGAGKSALVEHFLDQLELQAKSTGRADVLVLRSRCYEREAMPFKALDGVMDALVRHLSHLDDLDVAHLLPTEVATLAQLFPVLERLHAVQHRLSVARPQRDTMQERQRAEVALRDLFARLAADKPLLIWIDDLQWGDLDSASMLKAWLQQLAKLPLMLVFSYRSDEVATSSCLRLLLNRDADAPAAQSVEHCIDVSPLGSADVQALCRLRLGAAANMHQELVERIVRESQGSPFLASQLAALAEAKIANGDTDLDAVSIDELLAQTSALLPGEARQILNVLAVAGRPMLPQLALHAAGVRREGRALLHALRGLNLVRMRDASGQRLLEVYHDRVRERVYDALDAEQLVRVHECLLSALEFSGQGDPDWLHTLALGAGQRATALRYGITAAERANATLAFERAVELYQSCLELTNEEATNRCELWCALGLAHARCARGVKASEAYLQAIKFAPAQDSVRLTRLAASHLLRSGRFEEGEALVRKVLEAMDLKVPETDAGLIAAIGWERARLKLRGMGYTPRAASEVPASLLSQIDTFESLCLETQAYDPLRAGLFAVRGLHWALQAGEPSRVVRALCNAASMAARSGSAQAAQETDALFERAEPIARELGTEHERAAVCAARAICSFLLGRRLAVIASSAEAERIYRASASNDEPEYYRRLLTVAARLGALCGLGDNRRFLAELHIAIDEARATDNRNVLLQVMLVQTIGEEIEGQAQCSRQRLEQQHLELPRGRFGNLHLLHIVSAMRTACSTGEYAWAATLLDQNWERYLHSPVRKSPFVAYLAHAARSRLLLNQHIAERRSGDPAGSLRSDLRMLEKLNSPLCTATVLRTQARLAYIDHKPQVATELLRKSSAMYAAIGAVPDATRDRYALGFIVGGAEGEALRAAAHQVQLDNAFVNPLGELRAYFPELIGNG